MRKLAITGVLGMLAAVSGCTSGSYARLPDQPFNTRGASASVLGAYGVRDGNASFERLGVLGFVPDVVNDASPKGDLVHKRATLAVSLKPATDVHGTGGSTLEIDEVSPAIESVNDLARVFRLRVYDLNPGELIEKLNSDENLVKRLAASDDSRIVTAVAVLDGRLRDDPDAYEKFGVMLDNNTETAQGQAEMLPVNEVRNTLLTDGVVYAYQMSRLGWSLDGKRIVALKPDLPGAGAMPEGAYTRAEVKAERRRQLAEAERARKEEMARKKAEIEKERRAAEAAKREAEERAAAEEEKSREEAAAAEAEDTTK